MKTLDALEQLKRYPTSALNETTLKIVVHAPGRIGAIPTVALERLQQGIDWDRGKMLLYPAQPLSLLTPEDVAAIHVSVAKGQSWHAYQQYKRQDERIQALIVQLQQHGITPVTE